MKFLFVANTLPDPNAGASGCDLSTIHALKELGHEVDAVWTGGWKRRIKHHNLHQLLELPRWFSKIVTERCVMAHYDVIQVAQPHAWLAAKTHRERKLPGIFINRSHGWEPCAWQAQHLYGRDTRPLALRWSTIALRAFLKQNNRLVLKYCDGLVVGCTEDREGVLATGGILPKDILVLALGAPHDFLKTPPSSDAERFCRVLHVGSFSSHKAPDVVAAVMRILSKSGLELTWVGNESDHAAIRTLLGEAASKVRLAGWMPRTELKALFDTHGMFLQPSYFEGFGMAFLEAMARGCCVFGTNTGGMRDLIQSGNNGYLFERGVSKELAQTLMKTSRDRSLCKNLSAKARATAERFTWRRTAQEYADFCEAKIQEKKNL